MMKLIRGTSLIFFIKKQNSTKIIIRGGKALVLACPYGSKPIEIPVKKASITLFCFLNIRINRLRANVTRVKPKPTIPPDLELMRYQGDVASKTTKIKANLF